MIDHETLARWEAKVDYIPLTPTERAEYLALIAEAKANADLRRELAAVKKDADHYLQDTKILGAGCDRLRAQVARLTEALEKTVVSKNWLDAVTIAGTALRGTP